jgi:hypothetical protein
MGYVRPPGVYFDTIGIAFDMLRSAWGIYAASSLLIVAVWFGVIFGLGILLLGTAPAAMFDPSHQSAALAPTILVSVVGQFFQGMVQICLMSVALRHALGNAPEITDLFMPFQRFGRTVAATGILMIPGLLGNLGRLALPAPDPRNPLSGMTTIFALSGGLLIFWLLVGGGIYLGAAAVAFSDLPIGKAFTEAFRRLGWQLPLLSGLYIIAGIVSAVGIFACCIGIIATLPIAYIVIALHYCYYFPPQGAPAAGVTV